PVDAVRLTLIPPEPEPEPEPGPLTIELVEIPVQVVPRMEGGDPSIDDDPHPSLAPGADTSLVGTCSAARAVPGGAPAPLAVLVAALFALVWHRRRDRG